jgi:hypothetical protein
MDSINHTGGAVNDRLVDTMRVVKKKAGGAAAAVQDRAAVGQQRAQEIAARNPVVAQRRPEDAPAEAEGLSTRDKARAILAEKKAALKAKFPDAFGQKEAREAAAEVAAAKVAVPEAAAAAAVERAAPVRSTISRRAGRGMRRSYSATIEQIRRAPEALKQAVRKRFIGTDEQINLEDEINRRSARAGVLAAAARKQAVVEAQAKRVAVAAKPENILRPSVQEPARLALPRRTGGVQFSEEPNEFRFFRPGEEE